MIYDYEKGRAIADCGCVSLLNNGRWYISAHCDIHEPNYRKKADKAMRRLRKKTGRGYTKSNKKK